MLVVGAGVAAAVPRGVPMEKPPVLAAGALVAAPNENPPPVLADPRVPDPKLKPDILSSTHLTITSNSDFQLLVKRLIDEPAS